MPHFFFRILENMPWFIQEGIIGSELKDPVPRNLRHVAKLMVEGYDTDLSVVKRKTTALNIKDLNFLPKVIVFGHTHFLDSVLVAGKYVYVNTGSWRDTLFVNRDGQLRKMNNHYPYIEVLPAEPGGLPTVTQNRYGWGF